MASVGEAGTRNEESAISQVSEEIKQRAADMEKEIIAERRYFHKHPELSLKETETANALCWRLASMGIEYTRVPGNGIIATIKGTAPDAYDAEGNPRRRIALRSDIDALPVTELTGAPYASENEGVMHACGHDCHMSMLLGAARILLGMTDEIHGEVRLLFQPAEECSVGSRMMIKAGALDWFRIDIKGVSAHGSMPHKGVDAVVVAAEIVVALQVLVSRDISPFEPLVVTVGEIHGGEARNIMAGSAYLTGTIRTWSDKTRKAMPERLEHLIQRSAKAFNAKAKLTYQEGNAGLSNDSECAERCRKSVVKLFGEEAVSDYEGTLAGEDFSEYLDIVPGVFVFLGCRNPDVDAVYPQHSGYYTVDESVLKNGAALAAQYAIDFLAE